MDRRIFFQHIQKAAGMSLYAALAREYGQESMSPQIYGMPVPTALTVHRGKRVIAGHMLAVPGTKVPGDFYSLTILRDPVERFVSHLFFNLKELGLQRPPQPVPAAWWDEVLGHQGVLALGNWQVESLYRYGIGDEGSIRPEDKLEGALRALEQFNLVGTVEEFRDVLSVLAIECGWSSPPAMPHDNATASRPAEIETAVRDRIALANALDIALWKRARALFDAKRTEVLSAQVGLRHEGRPAAAAVAASPAPSSAVSEPRREKTEVGTREIEIRSSSIDVSRGSPSSLPSGTTIVLGFEVACHTSCDDLTLGIAIVNQAGETVFGTNSRLLGSRMIAKPGDEFAVRWRFACSLGEGAYRVSAALHPDLSYDAKCFHFIDPVFSFTVAGGASARFEGRFDLRPILEVTTKRGIVEMMAESERATDIVLDDFRSAIRIDSAPGVLAPGQTSLASVEVANLGGQTWPCGGGHPVCVAYHWLRTDGECVVFEGERTRLPDDLLPGERLVLRARVLAPEGEGAYILRCTLVQEGVAWFNDREPRCISDAAIEIKR